MAATTTDLPPLTPFIAGAFRSSEGPTFETRDPARNTLIAEVTEATEADVDAAVAAAWSAYRGAWGALSLSDRARLLRRVAELIDARRDELAALEALDAGKPIRDCLALMEAAAAQFAWCSATSRRSSPARHTRWMRTSTPIRRSSPTA